MNTSRVILGVAGASGAALCFSVARQLAELGAEIDLVYSTAAERTLIEECGPDAPERLRALATDFHAIDDIGGQHRIGFGSCFGHDRGAMFDAFIGGNLNRSG